MNPQAQLALELGRQLVEGLERKDSETIIALLHEDIVLEVPFPIVPGEDAIGARIQRGKSVHDYIHGSNQLTARVAFNNPVWRTTDDGLAMLQAEGDVTLADGRPYRNTYLFLFEARDGKIVRWWEYYSPVIAARAFGTPLESIP